MVQTLINHPLRSSKTWTASKIAAWKSKISIGTPMKSCFERHFGSTLAFLVLATFGFISQVHAQMGADQININGQYVLAAKAGKVERVGQLLRQGAAVDSRDRLGNSPLNMAAAKGNEPLVDMLLAAGANPNLSNLSDVTPLMGASFVGNANIVRKLLGAGASVNVVDRVKKTAATYAAANGCVECMKALFAAGVAVNARLNNDLTLLMWAAPYGQAPMVRYLLDQGADKNATDDRGQTAMDLAREAKQDAVVSLLQ
jgi:hypothetical protein